MGSRRRTAFRLLGHTCEVCVSAHFPTGVQLPGCLGTLAKLDCLRTFGPQVYSFLVIGTHLRNRIVFAILSRRCTASWLLGHTCKIGLSARFPATGVQLPAYWGTLAKYSSVCRCCKCE